MILDQLQARLATYYAHQSTGNHVSLGPLVALSSGWASGVYTFTVQQHESDCADEATLVLKTYAPTASGRETAIREWQALTRLRAVDYPVPHVTLLEPDDRHLGCPFIVMEQVPGIPLWDALQQADQPNQDRLTKVFVNLLVALHALDPHVLEPTMPHAQPYAFVEHELEHIRRASQSSSHPKLSEVVAWLDLHKHDVPCHLPVILHRDYHPWNVLVDAARRYSVIDWDWQIGDFRFDLAWTLMLMRRSGFHAFSAAVQDEYVRQSNRSLDNIDYFEVLTSVRWLLNVTRSLQSGEALRDAARPAFRDFLVEPVQHAVAFLQEQTGVEVQVTI